MTAIAILSNPNVRKTIIIIAIIVVAYFVFKFASEKFTDWNIKRKMDSDGQANKDIIPKELTYSDSEYIQMAQQLFEAMNGVGTTVDTITGVAKKLKTKSDWLRLVNKFGTRTLSSGIVFIPDFTGDLYQCLESELSTGDKKDINNELAGIGINI